MYNGHVEVHYAILICVYLEFSIIENFQKRKLIIYNVSINTYISGKPKENTAKKWKHSLEQKIQLI